MTQYIKTVSVILRLRPLTAIAKVSELDNIKESCVLKSRKKNFLKEEKEEK